MRTSSTAASISTLMSGFLKAISSPLWMKFAVAASTAATRTCARLLRPFFLWDGPLVFTSVVTYQVTDTQMQLISSNKSNLLLSFDERLDFHHCIPPAQTVSTSSALHPTAPPHISVFSKLCTLSLQMTPARHGHFSTTTNQYSACHTLIHMCVFANR